MLFLAKILGWDSHYRLAINHFDGVIILFLIYLILYFIKFIKHYKVIPLKYLTNFKA